MSPLSSGVSLRSSRPKVICVFSYEAHENGCEQGPKKPEFNYDIVSSSSLNGIFCTKEPKRNASFVEASNNRGGSSKVVGRCCMSELVSITQTHTHTQPYSLCGEFLFLHIFQPNSFEK